MRQLGRGLAARVCGLLAILLSVSLVMGACASGGTSSGAGGSSSTSGSAPTATAPGPTATIGLQQITVAYCTHLLPLATANQIIPASSPATTITQGNPNNALSGACNYVVSSSKVLLVVYFIGFKAGWLPFSDGYDLALTPGWSPDFILSAAQHAILPAFTIVISTVAGWMLTMRNSMITTLSEDYITMARAKGLTTRRLMFAYAARNAILPSVTGFAIAIGSVVGGQLLVEIVFSYPGIGFALYQGILSQDYALADGILLLVIVATVAMNLIVDLLYTVLDPRTRQERSA